MDHHEAPTQRRTIDVSYTEDIVRDAVRTFVWQRGVLGNKMLWATEAALIALFIWLRGSGENGWLSGVVSVVVLLPPCLVAAMWVAHHRHTVGKFRKMPSRQGEFVFLDDALEVASELGSAKIPWSSITEIWKKADYWMVFMGPNQFMTLPTATAAPTDLAFLEGKVPSAMVRKLQ